MKPKDEKTQFDIDALERNITLAQRLRFSKMGIEEVLRLSSTDKLMYFCSLQVQHPQLESAQELLEHYMTMPEGPNVVGLLGPSGSGKTSFYHSSILPRFRVHDQRFRPTLRVEAPSYGSKQTGINGIVRQLLRVSGDICSDNKTHYRLAEGRLERIPSTLDGQYDAMKNMLNDRRVRVVLIDEFLHVCRHVNGEARDALMDAVKVLADNVNGIVMLVGTPTLLPFMVQYGQVARRSEVIYLGRYKPDEESRANASSVVMKGHPQNDSGESAYAPIETIVRKLVARWPMLEVPQFQLIVPELMVATLGLIGLLKHLLVSCLWYQLRNGGTWESKFLEMSTKSKACLNTIEREVKLGEEEMDKKGFGESPFKKEHLEKIAGTLSVKTRKAA
jgi:hypothetical protein